MVQESSMIREGSVQKTMLDSALRQEKERVGIDVAVIFDQPNQQANTDP